MSLGSSAEFPNCFSLRPATVGSAAVSISIYNAIKSAAVFFRITNPDTPCGRITNAPELRLLTPPLAPPLRWEGSSLALR